jgi:tight adherence protein B
MSLTLDPTTLFALTCGAGVAVTFVLLSLAVGGEIAGRRYRRRLDALSDRAAGVAVAGPAEVRSLARRDSATPRIDQIARRWLPRRDLLAARLARTGYPISIGQYSMGMLGIASVAAIAIVVTTPIRLPPSILIGLFVGTALPHFVVGWIGKRRIKAFVNLFPEAIDLMVRALRSGLPISEAILSAAHEIADPVGAELRLVEGGIKLGRDLDTLLWDTAKRIDVPEFRFFVISLSVQRETGGNLGETLANLSDVLRRRKQMQSKVRAMASETRATTAILGGLPMVVCGALAYTSPDYLVPLYSDVRGLIMLGVGGVMLVLGITIMMKMARFEI